MNWLKSQTLYAISAAVYGTGFTIAAVIVISAAKYFCHFSL